MQYRHLQKVTERRNRKKIAKVVVSTGPTIITISNDSFWNYCGSEWDIPFIGD